MGIKLLVPWPLLFVSFEQVRSWRISGLTVRGHHRKFSAPCHRVARFAFNNSTNDLISNIRLPVERRYMASNF